MIDALKFVQGAVAKKDFAPELTHFSIKDGIILGYNGQLSLCSPIDLDWDINPKAIPFAKAIETCKDTVVMSKTESGRLSIKSGNFKAFVDCLEEDIFPHLKPEGEMTTLEEDFVPALANLLDFIGQDASRPWATGLLFDGKSIYATNNVVIAEQKLNYSFPLRVNIPFFTIKELMRVKMTPQSVQTTETSITFHFEGGRWLRSQLYSTSWPESMYSIINAESTQKEVPEGFFEALEDLKPFLEADNRVYFKDGAVSTHVEDGVGATIEVAGIQAGPCFQHKPLSHLAGKIKTIDFSMYPKPCIFKGDNFNGAIVGMRV